VADVFIASDNPDLRFAIHSAGDECLFATSFDGPDHRAPVEHLPGEPDQWFTEGMHEYLVIRDFPSSTTFAQFSSALNEGQGAACGLQPIQRVVSYWDGARTRGYCLYRAGSADVLRDAFTWLGLPPAVIHSVQRAS
jgi:hypothetical protein